MENRTGFECRYLDDDVTAYIARDLHQYNEIAGQIDWFTLEEEEVAEDKDDDVDDVMIVFFVTGRMNELCYFAGEGGLITWGFLPTEIKAEKAQYLWMLPMTDKELIFERNDKAIRGQFSEPQRPDDDKESDYPVTGLN